MLALLVFLMCAMVGSVVLASATAAAGRIKGIKEDNQQLYTLTSSANLLADEIKEVNCVFSKADNKVSWTLSPDGGPLNTALNNLIGSASSATQTPQTVAITFTGTELEKSPVDASISMDPNFNISIALTLNGKTDSPKVLLTMSAVPYENVSDSTAAPDYQRVNGSEPTQYPLSLTWDNPVITSGGAK